ncbi:chorismate--pyruvate lyase family protein [Sphingomonas sp. HT-1]|jgi:chorismate-pyruvate lyase|uniref:chorismate--pyruvate lyase family protein n=1 Tax=unclassified Sphingomonas TaxID=196159 RepID=UPI0003744C3D|nr:MULTISPECIES: hypothetical protein [unclassified Sphingomonas]KTF67909.1 hypothetical protein ATB93_01900 [Sphingomonas sp. WG]
MLVVAVAAATDDAAALSRDLLASATATAVLERRCGQPIRAEVDRAAHKDPTPEQRKRLGVGPEERVAYRSVVLRCAGVPFSVAENWYVPARLTPEMNAALEQGERPFGAVILPLQPHRKPLEQLLAGIAPYVLRHRALVLDAEGRALAEVVENYTAAVLK